jgi:glycosyltransferase involved in cell wall biosynthesis
VARARAGHPELRLRLTGEPTGALRAAVARLGLEHAVEFVGLLAEAELPDFYRSLDMFVIPSHQEGFGIVGVEAMACGVPVISTRCGGPEDFVAHERTGFLTGFDAGEIARFITVLVTDRQRRRSMSVAARDSAVANYSLKTFERSIDEAWAAVWQEAL